MRRLFILALWVISTGAACRSTPKEPLKIGIIEWPGFEFLYLAKEKRLYAENKVNFRLLEYNSPGEVRRGYEQGQINGFMGSPIEVLQIREEAARAPSIAFVTDFSVGADVVIASKEVAEISNLKGKRVAAEVASIGLYVLTRSLKLAGLKVEDIHLVPMDQQDMQAAFEAGEIDAAVVSPPVSIQLLERFPVHILFSTERIPKEVPNVMVFERRLLSERVNELSEIVQAFYAGVRYAKEHPKEAYALMAKREGLTPDDFASALQKIRLIERCELKEIFGSQGQLSTTLKTAAEMLHAFGLVHRQATIDQMMSDQLVSRVGDCSSPS